MNKSKVVGGILGIVVVMPIWYYLLYWILSRLNPDRLVWFLYWAYVPVGILVRILSDFGGDDE